MRASGGAHRTISAGAPRALAVVECTAPALAELAAPSTGTASSVVDLGSARGEVRRVNACSIWRASSSGPRTSVQRLSCRFCQRQRLNTSSQRQLSRARLSQRSTASKHRRPHRISAAVKYFEPTPARVRTPTCSGMKKNLKSMPNSRAPY